MYKSGYVHLTNKYPQAQIVSSDMQLDAFLADGTHLVALRKDGNGMWADVGAELGCQAKFDLNPLPRHARAVKLYRDGKVGAAEEATRAAVAASYVKAFGYVPSLLELAKNDVELVKQGSWLKQFDDGSPAVVPAAK